MWKINPNHKIEREEGRKVLGGLVDVGGIEPKNHLELRVRSQNCGGRPWGVTHFGFSFGGAGDERTVK